MSNRSNPRTTIRLLVACLATLATLGALSPAVSAEGEGSGGSAAESAATTTTTVAPDSSTSAGGPSTSARGTAEASVASLRRDRSEVRAELASAGSARDVQFDEWALNHLAMEAAQTEVNRTAMLAEQARRDVLAAERRVRTYATEAFMNPPALATMSVLSIADADQMSWAHDVLSVTADDQSSVVEELASAESTARRRAAEAGDAAAAAADRASRAKAELEQLEAALQHQQALAAEVDSRLDYALAEVAALDSVDRRAAEELEEQERELAEEAQALVAGNTQGRSRQAPRSTPTTTPPRTSRPTTTAPKPSGPPPPPPSNIVTWQDVTKVGSFWVHGSIAGQVRSLLNAASAAGFSLSGGGFRDPAEQIRLRQAHCGPTQYDIYQKRASLCSPPTARPGRSMHERGLALDVKSSGRLITSRSDPAFAWLSANAASFGFYNLPSEPWHWSTNGS